MFKKQDVEQLRKSVLEKLRKNATDFSFNAFLENMTFELQEDGRLYIVVDNKFIADRYEKEFRDDIEKAIESSTGGCLKTFSLIYDKQSDQDQEKEEAGEVPEKVLRKKSLSQSGKPAAQIGLNNKYTMETFIVGDSNRFAHAVSMAVTASPGDTYNPFFLYGGVGLGKTHLMQAIGHKLISSGDMDVDQISYVTSEAFCNEYIEAIPSNSIDKFRKKYRKAAVLLIDDVQFFGGKEKLQEEFFHTFNEIFQAGGQIVMTSDRPPSMLEHLQERLVSRFKSGVVADIKPPDLETRTAILRIMADRQNVDVKFECLEYIAERVRENIRELEGAFTKVIAMSSFMGISITIPMLEEVLSDFAREKRARKMTLNLIKEAVCEYYSIRPDDLVGKRRLKRFVTPRQVAMYLCHDLTEETLQSIGRAFGGKDHTTVLHAHNKIVQELEKGTDLAEEVKMIRIKLKESIQS